MLINHKSAVDHLLSLDECLFVNILINKKSEVDKLSSLDDCLFVYLFVCLFVCLFVYKLQISSWPFIIIGWMFVCWYLIMIMKQKINKKSAVDQLSSLDDCLFVYLFVCFLFVYRLQISSWPFIIIGWLWWLSLNDYFVVCLLGKIGNWSIMVIG